MPRTFGGRLTVAFVAVIALTLEPRLGARPQPPRRLFRAAAGRRPARALDDGQRLHQGPGRKPRRDVPPSSVPMASSTRMSSRSSTTPARQAFITDRLGQADVIARFGLNVTTGDRTMFVPAPNGTFQMNLQAPPRAGQSRENTFVTERYGGGETFQRYTLEITLANPSTFRASAIANLTGLLAAIALFALGLAVVVSAALTRRFTTPLRQLTDASRALAEGDLSRRVPAAQLRAGSTELGELAVQFNTMADRLEESVEISRRDRDRSRDFLADVSHELRTPLAALRTFNQLLLETAGRRPGGARRVPRIERRADRAPRLARPEPARALEARLRPRPAGPATRRPAGRGRIGGSPARLGRRSSRRPRHGRPSGRTDPHPPRSAAHRPGRREPGRQRDQVHAARRVGARRRGADRRRGPDRRHRYRRRHRRRRAAPHLRALLSRIARERGAGQRERARPGDRALDRRHARRDGRRSRAGPSAAAGSRCTCRAIPRVVAGTPAAARADVASAAEGSERIAAAAADGARDPHRRAEGAGEAGANVTETSPSDASGLNPASAP